MGLCVCPPVSPLFWVDARNPCRVRSLPIISTSLRNCPKRIWPLEGSAVRGCCGGGGWLKGTLITLRGAGQGLCDLVGTVIGYPFRFEVPVASVWNPCFIKYLRTNSIFLNKISRYSVGQLTPMLISCVVLHTKGILQILFSPCFFVCTNYLLNIYCFK